MTSETAELLALAEASDDDTVHVVCLACEFTACDLDSRGWSLAADDAPLDCGVCIVADEASPGSATAAGHRCSPCRGGPG